MRRVGLGDLVAAAGALAAVPFGDRGALMVQMLTEAETADAFRRREGRMHPEFGNGTLMAVALARPQGAQPQDGGQSLICLAQALEAVLWWQMAETTGEQPGGGKPGGKGYL
jgi:hypothetical protein